MTGAHVFYIPVVALAAIVIGFLWGRKAALEEFVAKQRLDKERQAAREARKAARQQKAPKES